MAPLAPLSNPIVMNKNLFKRSALAFVALTLSVPMLAAKYSVYVSGRCQGCKARIEAAALSVKGVTSATWNVETQALVAEMSDKSVITPLQDAVLAAGHDIADRHAASAAYLALPHCCRYRDGEPSAEEAALRMDTVQVADVQVTPSAQTVIVPDGMQGPLEVQMIISADDDAAACRLVLQGKTMQAVKELRQTKTMEVKDRGKSAAAHIFQYVGSVKANEQERVDTIYTTKSELVDVYADDSLVVVVDYANQTVDMTCGAGHMQSPLTRYAEDNSRDPMLLRLVLAPGEVTLKDGDGLLDMSLGVQQAPAAEKIVLKSEGGNAKCEQVALHRRKI